MPSKACETLLYPAVSHILHLVRLPGEYHNICTGCTALVYMGITHTTDCNVLYAHPGVKVFLVSAVREPSLQFPDKKVGRLRSVAILYTQYFRVLANYNMRYTGTQS